MQMPAKTPFKAAVILSPYNVPLEIPLYCMRCTNMLFKCNREVIMIYFGLEYPSHDIPRGMGLINIRCHTCRFTWRFYWQ
jgi:hypothetical protein